MTENPSDPIPVLVVDDDFMVAKIHARFVDRAEGFVVCGTARNGTDALAAIAELRPALVLLDVHLPDFSGLEVLRRLRAAADPVGIIMITAAREAESVRAAVQGGANHYLIKPFEYADLAARLQQFRAARALPAAPEQNEVDRLFAPLADDAGQAVQPMPKGLSVESGDLVLGALASGEMSAAECGEAVGMSRVSARRYLEHHVRSGRAVVRLQYGKAGRPERRYRTP